MSTRNNHSQSVTSAVARPALITCLLLIIPAIGTKVSYEWQWGLFDFILMGLVIFSFGLVYELCTRTFAISHKRIVGLIVIVAFLLVWAELAVGIIGTPFAGN